MALSLATESNSMEEKPKNVLGEELSICCSSPKTGFYRDGFCKTGEMDQGVHVICAEVTQEFLEYSRKQGNDLITPRAEFSFPGLKPGDSWCLCASRWKEAADAGVAPPVKLEACHEKALEIVPLDTLRMYQKQ